MKFLPLSAALAVTTLLFACEGPNNMKGSLTVTAPFKVKAVTGSLITVPVRVFPTTLKMSGDGAEAWIHYSDSNLVFKIPQVKEDNLGNVNITPARLKQEFGLQGKIFNKRDKFDRDGSQSCVKEYTYENQCNWKKVCETDADGNESCSDQYVCETVQIPVYGSEATREVGYQDSKVVDMNVVLNGSSAVAKFKGAYYYREHITNTWVTGSCY